VSASRGSPRSGTATPVPISSVPFASFRPSLFAKIRDEKTPRIAAVVAGSGAVHALGALFRAQQQALAPHVLSVLARLPATTEAKFILGLLPHAVVRGKPIASPGPGTLLSIDLGPDSTLSAGKDPSSEQSSKPSLQLRWGWPSRHAPSSSSSECMELPGLVDIMDSVLERKAAPERDAARMIAMASPSLLSEWVVEYAMRIDEQGGSLSVAVDLLEGSLSPEYGLSLHSSSNAAVQSMIQWSKHLRELVFAQGVCKDVTLR